MKAFVHRVALFTKPLFAFLNGPIPPSFLFIFVFHNPIINTSVTIQTEKVSMLCLGFEPTAVGG